MIGRGGVDDVLGRELQGLAGILALARALAGHRHVDAVIAEDALQQHHVGQLRHIVEDERLVGQETRDHQGKRRVLRARDRDFALQRAAAADADPVHSFPLWRRAAPSEGSV